MSLFNMLHGYNPLAPIFLKMLGLQLDDVGRFRDAYLWKDTDGLRIHVYTRNGGGNRNEYQHVFDKLSLNEYYERDYDDEFDCTYATIVFRIPPRAQGIKGLELLANETLPMDKFKETIAALRDTKPGDPVGSKPTVTAKTKEELEPVLQQIFDLYIKEDDAPLEQMPTPGVTITSMAEGQVKSVSVLANISPDTVHFEVKEAVDGFITSPTEPRESTEPHEPKN